MIFLRKLLLVMVLVAVGFVNNGSAQTENGNLKEQLLQVFHPYGQGGPKVDGIMPGMKLTKDNFQVAEKVLPPELLRVVQAGDMEITVQETSDFPLLEDYI